MVDDSELVIERPAGEDGTTLVGGDDGRSIVIANEFADVVICKVETRNGMRLEIRSPRRGTVVRLDAVALDCLSFQEPELITALLSRNPGQ